MNLTKNKMKPVTTFTPGEIIEEKYNGSNAKFVVFKTITFQEDSVTISFNSLENFQYISWGDGTLDTKNTSHTYEDPKEKSFVIVVYGVDYLINSKTQENVFSQVGYIEEVYFGEGVKISATDYGGFIGGDSLKRVNNISQIPTRCFEDQTKLTEITFGNDCTMIGMGAFAITSPLNNSTTENCLVIPKHIKAIAFKAFSNSNFKVCIEYTEGNMPEKYNDEGQIYYYYSETKPTTVGNYWHYVNGKPTIWTTEG